MNAKASLCLIPVSLLVNQSQLERRDAFASPQSSIGFFVSDINFVFYVFNRGETW